MPVDIINHHADPHLFSQPGENLNERIIAEMMKKQRRRDYIKPLLLEGVRENIENFVVNPMRVERISPCVLNDKRIGIYSKEVHVNFLRIGPFSD